MTVFVNLGIESRPWLQSRKALKGYSQVPHSMHFMPVMCLVKVKVSVSVQMSSMLLIQITSGYHNMKQPGALLFPLDGMLGL